MRAMFIGLTTLSLLCACSDSDDEPLGKEHDGIYQKTKLQKRASCSEQEPWEDVPIQSRYFKLEAQTFGTASILGWHTCTGPSESTCNDAIELPGSFVLHDGQWMSQVTWSMGIGGNCSLGSTRAIPVFSSTGFEMTTHSSTGDVQLKDGEKCDLDIDEKYFESLPCESMEYLEATRL